MIAKEHLTKLFENNPYLSYDEECDFFSLQMSGGRITEINVDTASVHVDNDIVSELEQWVDEELKGFFGSVYDVAKNNSSFYEHEEIMANGDNRLSSLNGKARALYACVDEKVEEIRHMIVAIEQLKSDIVKQNRIKSLDGEIRR